MNDATTRGREAGTWPWRVLGVTLLVALGGTGCTMNDLLNSDALPKGVSDPAFTQTPEGARAAYVETLAQFRAAFGGGNANGNSAASFVAVSGLLSDELLGSPEFSASFDNTDARTLPEGGTSNVATYSALQKIRGQAQQAIGLLTRYLPDHPALVGHLYAIQGYAEIFLADLFCSGIPLSTLDFGGDFTYRPGWSTESVFAHAVVLFDSTLALAGDSTRFMDLARVGRARALLDKGAYADAAAAAAAVPDGYHYDANYTNQTALDAGGTITDAVNVAAISPLDVNGSSRWSYSTTHREGTNGLDYRSGDPRTSATLDSAKNAVNQVIYTYYHPDKYRPDGSSPIVLASGVEARLIEAEAALQAGDAVTWLAKLNLLRQTAISPALPDTTDPGTADERVNLLFRERAFWLYLTGHRQGDLRRLIRQYGRFESDVYPVGLYKSTGLPYGSDVTVPIPATEFVNPLFTGCISRGA